MVCVSGPNTGLALPLSDPTDVCFSQLCKSTTVQLLPLKAEVTSFSGTSAGCCYRPPPAFSLCSLLFTGCVCLCASQVAAQWMLTKVKCLFLSLLPAAVTVLLTGQ